MADIEEIEEIEDEEDTASDEEEFHDVENTASVEDKCHGFGEEVIEKAVVHSVELEQAVIQEVEGVIGEFGGIPEETEVRRDNPSPQAWRERKAAAKKKEW